MTDFLKEIIEFLDANNIKFTVINNGGIKYIHFKGEDHEIYLFPIKVNATNLTEAKQRQQECKNILTYLNDVIIIAEDRWRKDDRVFKKRILAHLERHIPIYARNCEVRKIDKGTASKFMDENHSYGSASCKYSYGLFLKRYTGHLVTKQSTKLPAEGELIAVAEFSGARKWKKGEDVIKSYEWIRYASLPHIRVSGGMGKLLNKFIEDVKPDDVMSYADLEWSSGDVYKELGFKREEDKTAVDFVISPRNWERKPITKIQVQDNPDINRLYFFRNFGSAKYRLKLKNYQ